MLASQGAYLWSSGGKPRLPRAASTPAIDMRGTDGSYADNPERRKCTGFKIEEGTPERKEMRLRLLLPSKDMRGTDGIWDRWRICNMGREADNFVGLVKYIKTIQREEKPKQDGNRLTKN